MVESLRWLRRTNYRHRLTLIKITAKDPEVEDIVTTDYTDFHGLKKTEKFNNELYEFSQKN